MTETYSCRTLSVTIGRPPAEVHGFVANPQNLPDWARGLCRAVSQTKTGGWVAETQDGPVDLRLVEANELGVLDHWVTLGSGQEIYAPMRVVQNGEGSEVLFTIFRLSGVSDEQFGRDCRLVERDLLALKNQLEIGAGR